MNHSFAYVAGLLTLTVAASSCNKSFLDRNSPADLTYSQFYQTESDFQGALNACYFSLKSQVENLMIFNDAMTDNTYENQYNFTGDIYFFDATNVPTTSTTIGGMWAACYKSIAYANTVINKIGTSSTPDASKKVFTSEARFIRAYSYFNLVRIYGGVPKYETVPDIDSVYLTPRASVDDIYDFIIADLISAQNIDTDRSAAQQATAKGKVSATAVNALLGKVYLQRKDFAKAATTLGGIVNNAGLSLESDLSKLYDADDPFNHEIIFAVNYERVTGQNSPFTNLTLPRLSLGILPNVAATYGNGDFNIEPYFLASFADNDARKALIDSQDVQTGADLVRFYYSTKYRDLNTTASGNSGSDFIILRYADVLLMYADALNQSGQTDNAYPYINQVRARAGIDPLTPGYSQNQMNDALAQERQWEFLLEGDRWFDLSYRGFDYLKTTLNAAFPYSVRNQDASIEEREILFPLPGAEVAYKPDLLTQNPGY